MVLRRDVPFQITLNHCVWMIVMISSLICDLILHLNHNCVALPSFLLMLCILRPSSCHYRQQRPCLPHLQNDNGSDYTILFSLHTRLGMAILYQKFYQFTRYRLHFISDWGSVNETMLRCELMLRIMASLYAFCIHCEAAPQMNGRLLDLTMRLRIELIPYSTVYMTSDRFHVTFRAFSFENAKPVRNLSDQIGAISCKQKANLTFL